ncbi:hypothetical protein [Fischerella sp. NIES-3754]|uniref:hypothetical protein n=1 Tax=Fischerella sp. NIES-3754 TaxID=1752063 RepID=UPI0015D6F7F6|nr:hypothetical protein [Fischerella sp. NIES-3754]
MKIINSRDVAVQRLYKICNVSTKSATSLQNLQRLYKICNVSTKSATSLQNLQRLYKNRVYCKNICLG